MPILTHGSDLRLAPAIAPVVRDAPAAGGTVRGALEQLARAGFQAVQLDATLPGIRPRDLSPRDRKDLLAMLSRENLLAAGIDLFIPRRHYLETQHVDRAMAATTAAIELAADLGRLPVSLTLPVAQLSEDARSALVAAADGRSVRLAVQAEDQLDELLAWIARVDLPALGAGTDPTALLGRGVQPDATVHRLSKCLVTARLGDVQSASGNAGDQSGSGVRCAVGEGDLDVTAYRVAVDLAAGRAGPVVLDLRGLGNPLRAASAAKKVWEAAGAF